MSFFAAIIPQVSQTYEIRTDELLSHLRGRQLAEARGVVAWLAVKLGSGSLKEIRERFGRNESAMSVAIRRIEHRARESQGFHWQLKRLKEQKYSTSQV